MEKQQHLYEATTTVTTWKMCRWSAVARKHAQSCTVFIAREAAGLKQNAAKTTGSRCYRIWLLLYDRA